MGGSVEDVVLTTRTPDEETADGRIRNKEAIHKIRDAWIYKQVRNRQREFTQYRSVSRSIFGCSELWLGILDHAVKPQSSPPLISSIKILTIFLSFFLRLTASSELGMSTPKARRSRSTSGCAPTSGDVVRKDNLPM